MPFTLSQYRGVVGVFNSWHIHIKQHNIFKNAFSQSKVKQTIAKEIFSIFASFSIFLSISISRSFINLFRIKARFINFPVVRISYFCVLLTFKHHIWLYLIISNQGGDKEKNSGPKPNLCQSLSICHWNLNSISGHNFLIFMLYVCQRLILIHSFYMMTIIYKFQVINFIGKIILWILNEEVFVFTTNFLFH